MTESEPTCTLVLMLASLCILCLFSFSFTLFAISTSSRIVSLAGFIPSHMPAPAAAIAAAPPPGVVIEPLEYSQIDAICRDIIAAMYDGGKGFIGTKCVGVAHVAVSTPNQPPHAFYVTAVSGHSGGIGDDGRHESKAGTIAFVTARQASVNKLQLAHPCFVAPFSSSRDVYYSLLERRSWAQLWDEFKADGRLDSFITTFIQRHDSQVKSLREAFKHHSAEERRRGLAVYYTELFGLGGTRTKRVRHDFVRLFERLLLDPAFAEKYVEQLHQQFATREYPVQERTVAAVLEELLKRNRAKGKKWSLHHLTNRLTDAALQQKLEHNNRFTEMCKELGVEELDKEFKAKVSAGDRDGDTFLTILGSKFLPDPRSSRLADYVAQCSEDNAMATIQEKLSEMAHAEPPTLRRSSTIHVRWFSVFREKSKDPIVWKPLCAVCKVQFVWRSTHQLQTLLVEAPV